MSPGEDTAGQRDAADVLGHIADRTSMRWYIEPTHESDPSKVEIALRERVKELNCLYGITQLAETEPDSMEDFLAKVVDILPPSWQYPEITCARITFEGRSYQTRSFKATKWRQAARIFVFSEPKGEVEVFYLEERPPSYEGPFLREERTLLDAVAERIGAVAMRLEADRELQESNKQLTIERQALQEANTALRAVLARIEEEKRAIHKDIQANVEKVLMPIIYAMLTEVPKPQRKYVDLLRDNLLEITTPFASELSSRSQSLTPTEMTICNMVRSGLSSKEIAEMRGVASATISRHRERIRRKLGIANSKVNLTTYLQTIL